MADSERSGRNPPDRAAVSALPGAVCHPPGVVWISRLGHTYQIHPEPIIEPLPDPPPTGLQA
ncbi:MAG: hypothetical protein LC799_26580, partial [Actinobacteria bacterium]|nr:hypothetical protein [Actinomycetota bacterium]